MGAGLFRSRERNGTYARSASAVYRHQQRHRQRRPEHIGVCERYYALQDEVRSVEQLRKGAENIMREEVQERQPHRAQDIDL